MNELVHGVPLPLHICYDESGGYDCITPAAEIRDNNNNLVCVIDAKDHGGSNWYGLGSSVVERRAEAVDRIMAIAKRFVQLANDMQAKKES